LVDDFDLFWVKLLTKQQMSPIIEEMEKKHSINPKYTKKININKIKTSGVKISDFDYTTNNPKIPFNFVEANGKTIHSNSGDLSLFFE
jgi:hypothetical protein